jgi:carbon storage regulator
MLVLSRRPQQSFIIGHDIVITVLEVNGDTVRLGIAAPKEVAIHREEVYRELQQANTTAASPSSDAVAAFRQRSFERPRKKKGHEPPSGAVPPAVPPVVPPVVPPAPAVPPE